MIFFLENLKVFGNICCTKFDILNYMLGTFLAITGRNEARLEEVKKECESLGAKVELCTNPVENGDEVI
jgi:hypothetical protein